MNLYDYLSDEQKKILQEQYPYEHAKSVIENTERPSNTSIAGVSTFPENAFDGCRTVTYNKRFSGWFFCDRKKSKHLVESLGDKMHPSLWRVNGGTQYIEPFDWDLSEAKYAPSYGLLNMSASTHRTAPKKSRFNRIVSAILNKEGG